jgi:hypothetical protein
MINSVVHCEKNSPRARLREDFAHPTNTRCPRRIFVKIANLFKIITILSFDPVVIP